MAQTILAIDVGEKRIGVARAHLSAPFPQPLRTLQQPETFIEDITALCEAEKAGGLVIGLPRGLEGQETAQTKIVKDFAHTLEGKLSIPIYWNDEAATSVAAEAVLRSRGKPYSKPDIDALAAAIILEDFISNHPQLKFTES